MHVHACMAVACFFKVRFDLINEDLTMITQIIFRNYIKVLVGFKIIVLLGM